MDSSIGKTFFHMTPEEEMNPDVDVALNLSSPKNSFTYLIFSNKRLNSNKRCSLIRAAPSRLRSE